MLRGAIFMVFAMSSLVHIPVQSELLTAQPRVSKSLILIALSLTCSHLPSPLRADDITELGGELTAEPALSGPAVIQVNAPNVTGDRKQQQLAGFATFHRLFTKQAGLGPRFINSSCSGCHVNNGRGPLRVGRTNKAKGSTVVIKVSKRGLNPDGSPKDVPGVGEQLLDQSLDNRPLVTATLSWLPVKGSYPDGTRYKLRKPRLEFRIKGESRRKLITSLRMTPAVIGPGLLESIPAETIMSLADPDDTNADGISGRPQLVPDKRSGQFALGRFGFRGSHTTAEQQSAAALIHDMGVTNPIFSLLGKPIELDQAELDILTIYQELAGMPRARDQADANVVAGKVLFQSIGCDGCHTMTLQTRSSTDPELDNQTIHPFTDLLLHDMGDGLADKRAEFQASGREWRTTPLWGLGFTASLSNGKPIVFLHDGRARTIEEAILWHGGEAQGARDRFTNLSAIERQQLLIFLGSL
jgi:CxxC motif-containing protein (DUF1111 family)